MTTGGCRARTIRRRRRRGSRRSAAQLPFVKHTCINPSPPPPPTLKPRDQLDSNKKELWPVLTKTYGAGNEMKWFVNWRLFFLACAELFGFEDGQEWIVSHYLFVKP